MWNEKYSISAIEVLDILENTDENDVKKIPEEFIIFLLKNSKDGYVSTLNHDQTLEEMNLSEETRGILGLIYKNWWATSEEKLDIEKNIRNAQKEIEEKYSYDNLFKKEKNDYITLEENNNLITQKETLFVKIKNFMLKLLRSIKN